MSSGVLARREPCTACGQPVFLAQRLLVDHRLYHRTCFRCARCGAQLTFSGCYQTETDGQYCCETCPDEETNSFAMENSYTDMDGNSSLFDRSDLTTSDKVLSDEEKFNLKSSPSEKTTKDEVTVPKWESSIAFTGFVSDYLNRKDSDDEDVLPALPTSLPPDKSLISFEKETVNSVDSKFKSNLDHDSNCSSVKSEKNLPVTENILSDSINNDELLTSGISVKVSEKEISVEESKGDNKKFISNDSEDIHEKIHSVDIDSDVNILSINQPETASCLKNSEDKSMKTNDAEAIDEIAKDNGENIIPDNVNKTEETSNVSELSLVKSRMKIFETNNKSNINVSRERNIQNANNQLYDKLNVNVTSENKKSDVAAEENSQFDNALDIGSVSKTEILENSEEMKSDNLNEEVSYSNNISHVPFENSENMQDFDAPNEISTDHIEINYDDGCNIETQSNCISQNNEDGTKQTHQENKELMNIVEFSEPTSQDDLSANDQNNGAIKNEISNVSSENQSNILKTNDTLKEDILSDNVNQELSDRRKSDVYPDHLNPFSDDDDEEEEATTHSKSYEDSKNPFECSSDEKEEDEILEKSNVSIEKKSKEKPPRPPPPIFLVNSNGAKSSRRVITAPPAGSNPFSSDEDENSEEENMLVKAPIPTPRQSIKEMQDSSSSSMSFLSIEPRSFHGSSSSLTSTVSRRKKGQAPKPPSLNDSYLSPKKDDLLENLDVSKNTQTSHFSSSNNSSISPRSRKRRPAPLPPSSSYEKNLNSFDEKSNIYCSTPILQNEKLENKLSNSKKVISAAEFDNDPDITINNVWENESLEKDEKNKEKENTENEEETALKVDKSVSGQWKRRKGPAPAIPLLQKRNLGPPMPPAVLRRELQMLEAQQRGLEKQGVRLEELIRERCENNPSTEIHASAEPDPETDELVLQLFELVNEKNELFRRQSELMYIRRQQRLEEEHADLEHQIRILMARPEANKTDTDKAKEEQLIQRLVEVVERRNEVITSLEMDRLREKEEDKTISERMASHRAKREENSSLSSLETQNKEILITEKKKNKKNWIKKVKSKKNDTNKPTVDERSEQTVQKDKKHKKWF